MGVYMGKDIYKKGLILLAIIVIAVITVLGYIMETKDNSEVLPYEESGIEDDKSDEEIKTDEDEKKKISTIVVDINGAVKKPGIYELNEGMRVNDAIDAAGGFTEDVNSDYVSKNINKARILRDEEKIYIPCIEDDISLIEENIADNNANINTFNGKININTASKEQLITLKGIGDAFAQRIIDYRNDKKFSNIEDIKNVKGIGDKTFEQIKDYIRVE